MARESEGQPIDRYGRDPGSNWHTYFPDPTGHTNELEYGIEQIGWDGLSKPEAIWPWATNTRNCRTSQRSTEIAEAAARGIDLNSGHRWIDDLPKIYDVGGILLAQPVKPARIGPASIFVEDVSAAERFYSETLGLIQEGGNHG